MPQRITIERLERNAERLRELVDAGSSSVVRDPVVGSAISGFRRVYPLPGIGHRSGRVTVTGYIKGKRGGVASLIVKCDCGFPEYTVDLHSFKDFRSKRCNVCAKKESARSRYWKYHEAMPDIRHRERLLNRLSSAITRCRSPNSAAYKHYGARGISVCQAWIDDRSEFLSYVQTLDGWDIPEFEMDRINTNGNYEPGNIRFCSAGDNAKNKRRVEDLEAEITRLRLALVRAEEQIHNSNG